VASFPTDRADAGPSAGRLPTDPFLVNGPVVNRALLNAMFPAGSIARNTGVTFLDTPDRRVPNTHQITFGYERQLLANMAVNVDYVRSWNRDLLVNFDLNPARRVDTSRTGRLVYTDLQNIAGQLGISPFVNAVLSRQNLGSSEFDGVNMMLEKRFSNHWAARVSYALGNARGNAEASQINGNLGLDYQVLGDPGLDRNFGPLDADRLQNLVVSGRVDIPYTGGLQLSGVFRYLSGASMTLFSSAIDADRNGRLVDPLAAGRYCGVGLNSICVENDGGRNGAKGPDYYQTDLRFSYRIRLSEGRSLDANFELFNIFNTANFANPTSDQRLSDFLILTALRGGNGQPRAAQVGVRLGF
jgi:hypothetical protein